MPQLATGAVVQTGESRGSKPVTPGGGPRGGAGEALVHPAADRRAIEHNLDRRRWCVGARLRAGGGRQAGRHRFRQRDGARLFLRGADA